MQLRPYQETALAAVRDNFAQKKRRVILCLPTGAGKTVCFSSLAARTVAKDKRVVILTDRIELLTQASGSLTKFGIPIEAITAKSKDINPNAKCYVAMVETFFRRLKWYPWLRNVDLLIIDEAHKGNFKKIFAEISPDTYVIGATATPIATSKRDPLNHYYHECVNSVQIGDLIEEGFLVDCITYSARIDSTVLKVDGKGEYTDESQLKALYAGVVDKYQQFGGGGKCICFNVNVAHSLRVTEEFRAAGYTAEHIDGTTESGTRDRILSAFKRGEIQILNNVGILNAGFDDPATSVVIVNRATTSVALYLQMAGRGSRPFEGKQNFTLIDMGANYARLGMWQDERDWAKIFRTPAKDAAKGVAPVKTCPDCEAIVQASAKICPYCSAEFPEKEKEEIHAEFAEIGPTAPRKPWNQQTIPELVLTQTAKKYKHGWLIRQIRERSETPDTYRDLLMELASIKGYKMGWVNHQVMNYANV